MSGAWASLALGGFGRLWELLLQIRVAFDAGVLLCRFRSWLVIESDGICRDHVVLFAVQIGVAVAHNQAVSVSAWDRGHHAGPTARRRSCGLRDLRFLWHV